MCQRVRAVTGAIRDRTRRSLRRLANGQVDRSVGTRQNIRGRGLGRSPEKRGRGASRTGGDAGSRQHQTAFAGIRRGLVVAIVAVQIRELPQRCLSKVPPAVGRWLSPKPSRRVHEVDSPRFGLKEECSRRCACPKSSPRVCPKAALAQDRPTCGALGRPPCGAGQSAASHVEFTREDQSAPPSGSHRVGAGFDRRLSPLFALVPSEGVLLGVSRGAWTRFGPSLRGPLTSGPTPASSPAFARRIPGPVGWMAAQLTCPIIPNAYPRHSPRLAPAIPPLAGGNGESNRGAHMCGPAASTEIHSWP